MIEYFISQENIVSYLDRIVAGVSQNKGSCLSI
jgi:hypothetical protein